MSKEPQLKIGAHYSIRGGVSQAAKQALAEGAGAFQYFSKNPRSLVQKTWDTADAEICRGIAKETGLVSVIHTPYPANLAAAPDDPSGLYAKTVISHKNDLAIAEAFGSVGIVVHFGIFKESNPLQGYKNIIQCINEILETWDGKAMFLLENQAGNHGEMGMTPEELLQIRKLCHKPEKIGFCFDTCHAFAAGVWKGAEDEAFFSRAEELGFWDHVACIHLNDCLYPSGDRKDRHARIGRGYIGTEGFRRLLKVKQLWKIPFIMETEAGMDGTYREDIELAKSWGK